ncbi:hypothetical protein PENNAL_c0010G09845 [Penicillium nalgiovense]|uniref:Uncharacterized protein n=1 Tax=Penicillium nalgiovense TaxID=60175 RepID=A0A1V6YVA5_PENNA|nr:hypothetical protein PENNAL_c0010G09845 [Penicillium nalgiovense]
MSLLGSQRPTSDVDILVSSSKDITSLVSLLAADEASSNENGQRTFEQASPHCLPLKEVKIPEPDYSLAMKARCFYLREDNENGHKKRESDIMDIRFSAIRCFKNRTL